MQSLQPEAQPTIRARTAEAEAVQQRAKAEESEAAAQAAKRETAHFRYLRQVDLAHREWQAANIDRTLDLLKECDPGPDHRPWEWRYVERLCHRHLLECQGDTD
jgi:hypothetical protein